MTSSLVGSEMCIRDRNTKISAMSPKSVLIKIGNEEGMQWNMYHRKFRCCLLYTSDAADDM
eukprot:12562462-Prorocentrum_lima.AAC.1